VPVPDYLKGESGERAEANSGKSELKNPLSMTAKKTDMTQQEAQ